MCQLCVDSVGFDVVKLSISFLFFLFVKSVHTICCMPNRNSLVLAYCVYVSVEDYFSYTVH